MKSSKIIYPFIERVFPRLVTSRLLISHLRDSKVEIGKNTVFFNAGSITIDYSRPELLTIGEYCKITSGVVILTHDYSRSVLRRVYGEIVAEAKETKIGNNVFIGMNSIILMGTKIGDNSIIGAGSICSGQYPPNSVIAGNPARVICTLDEYYHKRKKLYINEAKEYVQIFNNKFGRIPSIHEMGAFFPLYLERTRSALKENEIRTKLSGDEEEEIIDFFLNSKSCYSSYEAFIQDCNID